MKLYRIEERRAEQQEALASRTKTYIKRSNSKTWHIVEPMRGTISNYGLCGRTVSWWNGVGCDARPPESEICLYCLKREAQ